MKVLVINGSPRGEKSNSMQLTRAFLKGFGADAEVTTIHLASRSIAPCTGCFSCWNRTPGTCVLRDDMDDVLPLRIEATHIIWSFPLYYYSVPGAMKNMIDRQLPMLLPFMTERADHHGSGSHPLRYDTTHQKHLLLSTCGFYQASGNYDAVHAMFDHICGVGAYETIFCGQGELFARPELRQRTSAYLALVTQAGQEYRAGGITPATKESLQELLFPKETFEAMADVSWGVEKDGRLSQDQSHAFTQQMAALYNPAAYDGTDRVIEFYYTDVNKTYQILLGKDGSEVRDADMLPYTTRIETPLSVWQRIAKGEISGSDAMMQRLYRVLGDFQLMIHWDTFFYGSTANGATPPDKKKKNPNMLLFLLPWIVFWVSASIHPLWGGGIAALAAACLSLFWIAFQSTLWEQLSLPIVCSLGIAGVMGASVSLLLPLSYGLFGLLWMVSVFVKLPLTAHYSNNQYGGAAAMQNPLFLRTNRILTCCWGVLYLFTACLSGVLMQTALGPYLFLINQCLPLLLGIFTFWFQRWYPKRVAAR